MWSVGEIIILPKNKTIFTKGSNYYNLFSGGYLKLGKIMIINESYTANDYKNDSFLNSKELHNSIYFCMGTPFISLSGEVNKSTIPFNTLKQPIKVADDLENLFDFTTIEVKPYYFEYSIRRVFSLIKENKELISNLLTYSFYTYDIYSAPFIRSHYFEPPTDKYITKFMPIDKNHNYNDIIINQIIYPINDDSFPYLLHTGVFSGIGQDFYYKKSTKVSAEHTNLCLVLLMNKGLCNSYDLLFMLDEKQLYQYIYQMLSAELLIHKHGIIHGDSNLGNILLFQINEKDPFNSSIEELLEGCRLRPIDFGASFYIDDYNNAKEYYKDYMGHDYTGKDIGKLVTLIDFMNLLECIEECLIQLFNNYPKQLIIDIKHYCMDILKLANEMPLNDLLFPPNLIGGEDIDDWLKTNEPLKHALTNKREPPKFLYEDIPSYRVMEKFFKK